MADQEQVVELSPQECWQRLSANELGRLAFRIVDEIHILPVNYAVRDESLLFRTAEGTKLLSVVLESPLALEIDGYDESSAWSVVVRGTGRLLAEDEAHDADDLDSLPWVDPETPKYNAVRIDPLVVSGRHFRRRRPGYIRLEQGPSASGPHLGAGRPAEDGQRRPRANRWPRARRSPGRSRRPPRPWGPSSPRGTTALQLIDGDLAQRALLGGAEVGHHGRVRR